MLPKRKIMVGFGNLLFDQCLVFVHFDIFITTNEFGKLFLSLQTQFFCHPNILYIFIFLQYHFPSQWAGLSRLFWKYLFSIFTVAIQIVNPKGPEINKLLPFSSNSRPHIQIMSLTLEASQMQRSYVKLLETSIKRGTPFHWRSFTKMRCSQDPENCI